MNKQRNTPLVACLLASLLAVTAAHANPHTAVGPDPDERGVSAFQRNTYLCTTSGKSGHYQHRIDVEAGKRPTTEALNAHIERTTDVPTRLRCQHIGSHGGTPGRGPHGPADGVE